MTGISITVAAAASFLCLAQAAHSQESGLKTGEETGEETGVSPLGLRRGSFLFYPSIEFLTGYSDNLDDAPAPTRSGNLSEVRPGLAVRSDWSRHSLEFGLRGSFSARDWDWHDGDQTANADVTARLDLYRDSTLTFTGGYGYSGDAAIRDHQYTGQLAYKHRFNRLAVTLSGGIAQYDYGGDHSGELSPTDAAVSDYREINGGVQVDYEISPLTSVFVRAGCNRRDHSQKIDTNGFLRGSTGYEAAAGLAWSNGSKLAGTASVGYQMQNPRDPALAPVRGVTVDGELTWQATALTKVSLLASTDVGETTVASSAGYVNRRAELSLDHALRRNIVLSGGIAYESTDYSGVVLTEDTVEARFGLDYLLNPYLALSAEATHTRFDSSQAGSDYRTNMIMFGIKAQR